MRLNRVLLLAATINILIFALVLTISCSGDNGPRGKAGTEGCTVKEDSNGNFTVICTEDGEEEIKGTLYKGGIPGAPGAAGAPGDNCWLGPLTANGYEILCGTGAGVSQGFMLGCTVKREEINNFQVTIACGKTEMSLCGGVPFDPKEQKCKGKTLDVVKYEPAFCGKNRVEYNPAKQYCGYAKGDKLDELQQLGIQGTTVYDLCGKPELKVKPFEFAWDDDIYCRYVGKEDAVIAGEAVTDFCNGQRINENSWKAQYCGFASATAATKTVLSGACDKPNGDLGGAQGPNEIAFAQGYCEIRLDKSGSGNPKPYTQTIYSEDLCGSSANNKPNNGSWKGEYCGYASSTSVDGNPTKVWKGICADGQGPHEVKFNDGYCTVEWADRLKDPKEVTKFTQDFCGEDPTKRPNDGEWKSEYCGFGEESKTADQVLTGVCDDSEAPNTDRFSPNEYCSVSFENRLSGLTGKTDVVCENGDKINEGTWKGEYCGYSAKKTSGSKTERLAGACDDGQGPNSEDFGAGYCTVTYDKRPTTAKPAFETEYTTEFCKGAKMNEGKWNKEYCGMSKKDGDENDKVYKDMCDDGNKPYEGVYPAEQYCQWTTETATGTTLSGVFCGEKNNIKFNEGKWEGKYCFKGNNAVGTCTAGLQAIETMKSTDEGRCGNPNILAACKREIQIASTTAPFKTAYFDKKCGYDIVATASTGNTAFTTPKNDCYQQNGGTIIWNRTVNDPSTTPLFPSVNDGDKVIRSEKPDIDFYVDCAFDKVGDYTINANNEVVNNNNFITKGQCEKLYQVRTSKGLPAAGVYYGRSTTTPPVAGLESNGLCLARNTLQNCLNGGKWVITKTTSGVVTPVQVLNYKDIDGGATFNNSGDPPTYSQAGIIETGKTVGRCEFTPIIPGGSSYPNGGTLTGAPTFKRAIKAKK